MDNMNYSNCHNCIYFQFGHYNGADGKYCVNSESLSFLSQGKIPQYQLPCPAHQSLSQCLTCRHFMLGACMRPTNQGKIGTTCKYWEDNSTTCANCTNFEPKSLTYFCKLSKLETRPYLTCALFQNNKINESRATTQPPSMQQP